MQRWTIVNGALLLLVVLFAGEIYGTWARRLPTIDMSPKPIAATSPPIGHRERGRRGAEKNGTPEKTEMLATIIEKDLFDPSRRPPALEEQTAAPLVAEPPKTDPPPGVTIIGFRILGKDREAFVTDASQGGSQRRLRVGDQVQGYTVKDIHATELVLTSPSGDEVVMPLTIEKGKGTPGRPVRPGQVASSPAAGVQVNSPAAGIRPPLQRPPTPTPAARRPPPARGQNPQLQQLPADVRKKLEQLRQREAAARRGRR
jgi:hypothetical protein